MMEGHKLMSLALQKMLGVSVVCVSVHKAVRLLFPGF